MIECDVILKDLRTRLGSADVCLSLPCFVPVFLAPSTRHLAQTIDRRRGRFSSGPAVSPRKSAVKDSLLTCFVK